MRLMCKQGISPPPIADIMTEVVKEKRKEGYFLAQTIHNMNIKIQTAIDVAAGVDKDWTIAQRTLKKLNECVNCALRISLRGGSVIHSY